MASSSSFPLALKVFFLSLVSGAGGGYGAFKLAAFLTLRYWKGESPEVYAMMFGAAAALIVGVCSAITAGVLAGRATRS